MGNILYTLIGILIILNMVVSIKQMWEKRSVSLLMFLLHVAVAVVIVLLLFRR